MNDLRKAHLLQRYYTLKCVINGGVRNYGILVIVVPVTFFTSDLLQSNVTYRATVCGISIVPVSVCVSVCLSEACVAEADPTDFWHRGVLWFILHGVVRKFKVQKYRYLPLELFPEGRLRKISGRGTSIVASVVNSRTMNDCSQCLLQ